MVKRRSETTERVAQRQRHRDRWLLYRRSGQDELAGGWVDGDRVHDLRAATDELPVLGDEAPSVAERLVELEHALSKSPIAATYVLPCTCDPGAARTPVVELAWRGVSSAGRSSVAVRADPHPANTTPIEPEVASHLVRFEVDRGSEAWPAFTTGQGPSRCDSMRADADLEAVSMAAGALHYCPDRWIAGERKDVAVDLRWERCGGRVPPDLVDLGCVMPVPTPPVNHPTGQMCHEVHVVPKKGTVSPAPRLRGSTHQWPGAPGRELRRMSRSWNRMMSSLEGGSLSRANTR